MIGLRQTLSLLFTAGFTLALAAATQAQQTVSGDITDHDGAPLPRVLVLSAIVLFATTAGGFNQ